MSKKQDVKESSIAGNSDLKFYFQIVVKANLDFRYKFVCVCVFQACTPNLQ